MKKKNRTLCLFVTFTFIIKNPRNLNIFNIRNPGELPRWFCLVQHEKTSALSKKKLISRNDPRKLAFFLKKKTSLNLFKY